MALTLSRCPHSRRLYPNDRGHRRNQISQSMVMSKSSKEIRPLSRSSSIAPSTSRKAVSDRSKPSIHSSTCLLMSISLQQGTKTLLTPIILSGKTLRITRGLYLTPASLGRSSFEGGRKSHFLASKNNGSSRTQRSTETAWLSHIDNLQAKWVDAFTLRLLTNDKCDWTCVKLSRRMRPISAAVTAEAWRHVYALWASNSDPEGRRILSNERPQSSPKTWVYPAALWTEKPRTERITATTLITAAIPVGPRRQQRFGKAGVVS
jgi:hypothetical protein